MGTRWTSTYIRDCKNIPGYIEVRCTWAADYHTVGGIYIIKASPKQESAE